MPNLGRPITISIITVLFVFICLAVFFKLFGPIPFFVQNVTTTKESLFSVDGTGDVTVIPDTAKISLGVTKKAATVQSAKDQVNTIVNKITQDIKNLGVQVKDIKTTNYSVNPEYDYRVSPERITGYNVSSNIEVKLQPIDKANDAIDLATKDGANQVGNVQFIVDDAKQKELLKEARLKAITDAKAKAESLANAAGLKLGRIVDVKESSQNNYPPYPRMEMMSADKAAGGAPTELNPGENKITSTVTLSYETF